MCVYAHQRYSYYNIIELKSESQSTTYFTNLSVPVTVFQILSEIISLHSVSIESIPNKVEVLGLSQYAQVDHRFELAKRAHRVSVFTEGILAMQNTLLGVLEVHPRRILDDGIRKELGKRIQASLRRELSFEASLMDEEDPLKGGSTLLRQRVKLMNQRLMSLSRTLQGMVDIVGVFQ